MRLTRDQSLSHLANGEKIRGIRCELGLTQLELAMAIDCSERLVRKMEKGQRVSLKSLTLLCVFLNAKKFDVTLADLAFSLSGVPEVAERWFVERFQEKQADADLRWFHKEISLASGTLAKLEFLDRTAEMSSIYIGVPLHLDSSVAVSFFITPEAQAQQCPSGVIWMNVQRGQIIHLHVLLDSESPGICVSQGR